MTKTKIFAITKMLGSRFLQSSQVEKSAENQNLTSVFFKKAIFNKYTQNTDLTDTLSFAVPLSQNTIFPVQKYVGQLGVV